jgi:hypothetical protein
MTSKRKNNYPVARFTILGSFLIAIIYVWFRIDPRLLYYDQPEIFLKSFDFFKNFINTPGGISTYFNKFFFQLNYYPFLGSFIIVSLAYLIGFSHFLVIKKQYNNNLLILILLPPFFTLLTLNQYISLPAIKILITLIFINTFILLPVKKLYQRIFFFFIFSIVVFYITKELYGLFVILCTIFEMLRSNKKIIPISYFSIQLLIVFLDYNYLFYLQFTRTIQPFSFFSIIFTEAHRLELLLIIGIIFLILISSWKIRKTIKLLLVPIFILSYMQIIYLPLVFKLLYIYFIFIALIIKPSPKLIKRNFLRNYYSTKKLIFVSLILTVLISIVFTFNTTTNNFLKLNYYSQKQSWNKVLNAASKIPLDKYDNISLSPYIIKALYYTGKLPYESFNYSHLYPPGIRTLTPEKTKKILNEIQNTVDFIEHGSTCFELGLINYAELMAYYALEYKGDLLPAFKQLVLVYILKDNFNAARIILNMLKKNLIQSHWADKYLAYLDNNKLITQDEYLMSVKSRIILEDKPVEKLMRPDYDYIMERLLLQNVKNKMAYEYMMTYFLLTGQADKITENIYLLNYYDITSDLPGIPDLYEEAVVIYMVSNKNYDPDIGTRKINISTVKEFSSFNKEYKNLTKSKLRSFVDKYKNSYFYYYKTHYSREI